jgi:hypothetical protein
LVVQIEAGKPWTGHLEVANVLQRLSGEVRVCDPYYGTKSLGRLHELAHCTLVRFLTKNPDGKEKSFLPSRIADFVKEYPQFELREYGGNDLHDRFIVTSDEFILLGHGLKDIGNKESFVVRLNRKHAGDLIDSLHNSFDAKWTTATPLH